MTCMKWPSATWEVCCNACGKAIPQSQPRVVDHLSRETFCMPCVDANKITYKEAPSKSSLKDAEPSPSKSSSTGGIGGFRTADTLSRTPSINDYCEIVVKAFCKIQDDMQGRAKVLPTSEVVASLAATACIQYFRAGGK